MFANSQMMGLDIGFPDVCFAPIPQGGIPIPYPNFAQSSQTNPFPSTTIGGNGWIMVSPSPAPSVMVPSPLPQQKHNINQLLSKGITSGGAESLVSKNSLPDSEIDLMVLSGLAKKPAEVFVSLLEGAKKIFE